MLGHVFFTRVKVNHRRVYSHMLAQVCAVAMTTGPVATTTRLVKNKAGKTVFVYFKKIQSLDIFRTVSASKYSKCCFASSVLL